MRFNACGEKDVLLAPPTLLDSTLDPVSGYFHVREPHSAHTSLVVALIAGGSGHV